MPGANPDSRAHPDAHAIVSSRIFSATPEAIFAAISDSARLAQWWGPEGCTNTFHEFDFRPGGTWRFTMHTPDGTTYSMDQQFDEIVPPERIVVNHFQPGHDFSLVMTLVAREAGTELIWSMNFVDAAEAERVRAFVLPANEQNFDRLAAHLSFAPPVIR
jgi:uncharacterized protein YndB with AHSA1/START domain